MKRVSTLELCLLWLEEISPGRFWCTYISYKIFSVRGLPFWRAFLFMFRSSSWSGRYPFKVKTRVRSPYGILYGLVTELVYVTVLEIGFWGFESLPSYKWTDGEIGKHAGFKPQWPVRSWGFDPLSVYYTRDRPWRPSGFQPHRREFDSFILYPVEDSNSCYNLRRVVSYPIRRTGHWLLIMPH